MTKVATCMQLLSFAVCITAKEQMITFGHNRHKVFAYYLLAIESI